MEPILTEKELRAIQTAVNNYEKHKANCRKYQQTHREKVNEISKRYYESMKTDPVKYEKYLERCRGRYVPVEVRRQREKEKAEAEARAKEETQKQEN